MDLENTDQLTVFHITHWKAGSQWLHKILNYCASQRIVKPEGTLNYFMHQTIMPGRVYPTLYATLEEFNTAILPQKWTRFVIIRDLRDTLISLYFSTKVSHSLDNEKIIQFRKKLNEISMEQGLMLLIDDILPLSARIQSSWVNAKEPIYKYEDLLTHDLQILIPLLSKTLQISETFAEQAILAHRFESLTGRKPGEEKIEAHERKGQAGDWKNYFTDAIKDYFKEKFGHLIIQAGYELNNNW